MAIYKLHSSVIGDAAAQIDVRVDGRLEGVLISMSGDADADNEFVQCEIGFGSTNGFISNDTNNSIAGARLQNSMLTSGAIRSSIVQHVPCNVRVEAGERIFLHTDASGLASFTVWLYVDDGSENKTSRRRR